MEVWELKLYFYPSAGGFEKKKEKKKYRLDPSRTALVHSRFRDKLLGIRIHLSPKTGTSECGATLKRLREVFIGDNIRANGLARAY